MYQQTHLIEAGLPSGTFSTADEALVVNRELGETDCLTWLMMWLTKMQARKRIARYPDGRYGPRP